MFKIYITVKIIGHIAVERRKPALTANCLNQYNYPEDFMETHSSALKTYK